MAVEVTRYEVGSIDVLGPDNDDTIAIANGSIGTLAANGLYLIKATTACRVRCKAGIANSANGRSWDAGEKEVRYLLTGTVIAVDALS